MINVRRLCAAMLILTGVAGLASTARAADPYEINAILSLTGRVSFVGTTDQQALKALEALINRTGGIHGRPLSFVISDDQSDPKTALQLAQGLIAKGVPIILGPVAPDSCAAIAPLVAQNGPLFYCLANAGAPTPGGYEFLTLFPYEAQFVVTARYFRLHGYKKIASIVSIDAGGQAAERALVDAVSLPENKSLEIVTREHFAATDLNVNAQMSRIKAANPDAVLAWATGGPMGTLFRGARDVGLDLPTVTSPGNLNAAFFKQYGSLAPANLLFAAVPYYGSDAISDRATKTAIATLTTALATVNAKPDMIEISAWDPAQLLVDALRKLGPDASAAKLHDYLVNLTAWTGVNGAYNFRSNPQRGIGENNIFMVRFDGATGAGVAVSKFGGTPLPGK
jgi:branched-chain amino acid transport system substrate-binding protein